MSNAVFIEENVRLQLESSQGEGIGVLVGRVSQLRNCYRLYDCRLLDLLQLTSKDSFVLHFVPTPSLEGSPKDCGTLVSCYMIFVNGP